MLEFLKKIFQNEELQTRTVTEISLHDMEEWLNEKAKPLIEEVQQQSEGILMKVDEELQKTRVNIEILENAKLQNPNIPFKAKQYMEGNRQAYIRSINSFLGHMEINNKDYFYLTDFCKNFDELINNLNKSTLRSYTILQEFLANETGKIAGNLRNFDRLFAELESGLKNDKLISINKTSEKVQNLKSKTRQRINFDVDLKDTEATLALASQEKDAIIRQVEAFSKSEEHNNFLSLVDQKKSKTVAFFQDQNTIIQSFSVLERPMRKYSHISFEHEEIVLDYLNNPVETLAGDKDLRILDILKNLEKFLEENQLQVDSRKKEKSIEEVKRLNRDFIVAFLKRYHTFKEEIGDLEKKIKRTGVFEKFKEFNTQLEAVNLKIGKSNEDLNKLKVDSVKISQTIANLTNEVEDDLIRILSERIKIIA